MKVKFYDLFDPSVIFGHILRLLILVVCSCVLTIAALSIQKMIIG